MIIYASILLTMSFTGMLIDNKTSFIVKFIAFNMQLPIFGRIVGWW